MSASTKARLDPADDVALSSFLDGSTCSPSERLRFPVDEGVFPETDTAPPPSPVNENFGGGVFSTLLAARDLVILWVGLSPGAAMVVSFSLDADDAGTPNGEDPARQLRTRVRGMTTGSPERAGEGALLGDAPPAMENPRPISGGFDTAEGEPARTPDGDAPPPKEEKPVPVPYDPPIAPISCAPVAIARGFARFEVPRLGEAPWSVSNKDAEVPPGAAVDVGPGAKFQVAHAFHTYGTR